VLTLGFVESGPLVGVLGVAPAALVCASALGSLEDVAVVEVDAPPALELEPLEPQPAITAAMPTAAKPSSSRK
jgi:hypothetical protein